MFYLSAMDWPKALEINKAALTRIIAGLVALLATQAGAARLPLPVYQLLQRILFPAESAVRRLIVIAARGLVVPDMASRPMPKALVIAAKSKGRVSFQLFDKRKHFTEMDDTHPITGPRVYTIDVGPLSPREQFLRKFPKPGHDGRCSEAETLRISQRLKLAARALEQLPREAKRMARWQKRRARMENPPFRFPMRPGRPPGHHQRPQEEIDHVLKECHALAWMALEPDTS